MVCSSVGSCGRADAGKQSAVACSEVKQLTEGKRGGQTRLNDAAYQNCQLAAEPDQIILLGFDDLFNLERSAV